jgi:asparagine synthetase B (glutamine-hydrolysing)
MRYFGVVLSKRGEIEESRLRLALETTWVARFQSEPKFAPEPIIWLSPSRRLALLSWGESANLGLYGGLLIIEEGPYALAGAGIYYDAAYRSDRELLAALAASSDPDSIVARLGGSFALCLCDASNDRVQVWNSVCCHSNVLYRDTQDLFVVSTRGLFVSQVSEGSGAPEYDRTGFGRFVHSGFFPSDRSAYRDVQHLEGYQSLLASPSGVRVRAIDGSFDDYGSGEKYPRSADFDEATQLLLNFLSAVHGDGVSISSGLSGGKDSRLIAAGLKAAGISARIYCGDNWSDHPDLIIGRRVAECLGIDAGNPRILDNDEPDPEILSVDVDEYFISQLRSWDAMRASVMRVPEAPNRRRSMAEKIRLIRDLSVSTDQPTNWVGLAGVGGELFRGGLAMRTHIGDAHFDEAFARGICEAHLMKGDNLLREADRKKYQAWFDDWFAVNFSQARPLAVLERYYLQKQINRATAPVMGDSFSFFTDAKLLRLISRFDLSVRQDELFHFELTRRLAPELEADSTSQRIEI